jgi:hypothetical protein
MKHSFMIELIPEQDGERTILRTWVESDGFVEIVYQEYKNGVWRDSIVTPAIEIDKFLKVANLLGFSVKEGLV